MADVDFTQPPQPFIAPGPRQETSRLELLQGRGGEQFRPDQGQQWTELSRLESLNSMIGFRPNYPGVGFRFLDELGAEYRDWSRQEKWLTPEEANARYPNMPVPFTEHVSPGVAAIRARNSERQREMQAWVSRGPEVSTWSRFTAGATSAADPLNLFLGLALGGETIAAKLGYNIAGNLALDIPTYALRKREQQEVNLPETVASSVAGGVIGTGINEVFRGVFKAFRSGIDHLPYDFKERIFKATIREAENGATIDVSPAAKAAVARAAGKVLTEAASSDYRFEPGLSPYERAFFAAEHADTGTTKPFSTDLGEALYLTDNKFVANNLAANPEGVTLGKITSQVIPKEAKLLDLDISPTEKVATTILEAVQKKIGFEVDVSSAQSLKEALQQISQFPESVPKIQEAIKEQGFNGAQFVEGEGPGQHNAVALFDREGMQQLQTAEPSNQIVPQITPEEAARESELVQSPERSVNYDPDVQQKLKELKSKQPETVEEADAVIKNNEAVARKVLEAQNVLPETKEAVAKIDEEFKEDLKTKGVIKVMADCILRGFT